MTTNKPSYPAGIVLIAAGAVCWSTAGVVMRGLDAGPWEVAFWRSLFMTAAMIPVLLVRRQQVIADCRAAGWFMPISGGLLACCFLSFILALSHTTVANTLFVIASIPLLTALIGRLFFGERVSTQTWLAIIAGCAGMGLMVFESLKAGGLIGSLFALVVAFCFSINANIVRRYQRISMLPGVFLAGLFSTMAAALFALPSMPDLPELGALAYLGFIQLGLGLVLFTIGTRSVPAAQSVLIGLVEVVLGPLWVWFAYDETPATLALVGGGIVLLAVAFDTSIGILRSARHRRPDHGR